MAKPYKNARYHVEIRYPELTQARSEYANKTMANLLADVDPSEWFGRDDEDGTVHYVFRTYKLGKVIEHALREECTKFEDASLVWVYRHWINKPSRTHVGLFNDIGIAAIVAPGDDFHGTMYKLTFGVETKGWFNNVHGAISISPELGQLIRLWFQGESTAVWNAQRRFRYELYNRESKNYGDLEYALSKARELLGDNAAIHCVNDKGDLYTISAYGISSSNYCSKFDRGDHWVFEYNTIPVGIPHGDVVYSSGRKSTFKQELIIANAHTILKRAGM